MRTKTTIIPVADIDAHFTPKDFEEVFQAVPEDCVLIGGQSVAWWAERYQLHSIVDGQEKPITSRDIDFWGTHDDLMAIASHLGKSPVIPLQYEMTVLVGAIALRVAGKKSTLDLLHTVPGLDVIDPHTAAIAQTVASAPHKLLILSPVSLVLTKLHALRFFPQNDRQDLTHLLISLKASSAFITESLQQNTKFALWNCNRLIDIQHQKPYKKLEQTHSFQIRSAIPIDDIKNAIEQDKLPIADRSRLKKFLSIQWARVSER